MIALLQRVREGQVSVAGQCIGSIAAGLVVMLGVQRGDSHEQADKLMRRVLDYRVFGDDQGKMNRSLIQVSGGLLLIPQFTLAADTRKGLRPGFSTAAPPELGRVLFEHTVERAREWHDTVAAGRFGADMQVALVNDGPVTFWLET